MSVFKLWLLLHIYVYSNMRVTNSDVYCIEAVIDTDIIETFIVLVILDGSYSLAKSWYIIVDVYLKSKL